VKTSQQINQFGSNVKYPIAICIISFLPCVSLFTQLLTSLMGMLRSGQEKIQVGEGGGRGEGRGEEKRIE
jgi:hypothetical protein